MLAASANTKIGQLEAEINAGLDAQGELESKLASLRARNRKLENAIPKWQRKVNQLKGELARANNEAQCLSVGSRF